MNTKGTPLKTALLGALLLAAAASSLRAQIVENYDFSTFSGNPSLSIPDGDAAGASDSRDIASAITAIDSITVTL